MSSEQQPPIVEADPRGDLTLNVGNPSDDPSSSRCFLVCSRTLARISPVFDRMLYGAFAESKGKHTAEAAWTIDLPEDPPFAFNIFVTISHGFVHKVPRSLSLDELYDLTVLTHYYDMTHILAPWASRWIASLHEPNPGSPILLAKLLWISWELGRGPLFESTARRILTEAPGSLLDPDSPLHTLRMPPDIFEAPADMPFPSSLDTERITAIRKQTIQAMLDVFYDLAEHLVTVDEKPRLCRHASYMGPHRCESMILGSLTFCLTRAGLWPLPEATEVDHSISALYEIMANLVIHDIGQPTRGDADHSSCNPRTDIMKRIKGILREMPNPVLDSHVKELDKKMTIISL